MFGKTSESRLFNARRNLVSGLLKQIIGIILTFLIRTAIIYILGSEYQGLSGLYTAILQVLNLTDLGFSTAVTFILYQPIAKKDIVTICAIVNFLRKVYIIIGFMILGIGIALMPFLSYLISGDYPNDVNLYVLFAIYLFNTVISYWLFAYKSTLLTAMQRDDVVSNIYTISSIIIKSLQLLLLFTFKNYYVYILILPIGSIVNNILLQYFSKKIFPQIIPMGIINTETEKELVKQVKAVFVNRLSDIARNCFDDIIISSFLGLVAVAAYDNYYYIYTAIIGVMSIIIHSIRASIGNSLVQESVDKNYKDLKKFTFLFMWVAGWCTICMLCLYQPFMYIWMKGKSDMILSFTNMMLFCIYFYTFCMTYTKGVYLEGKGLFWECRWLYIIEALGNLTLNVILGYFFGVTGVLIATIITILGVNFVGGTIVLFKKYFMMSVNEFLMSHGIYFIITTINGIACLLVTQIVQIDGIVGFVIKLLICVFLPNLIYLIIYYKTKSFRDALEIVKMLVYKKKS